VKFLQNRLKAFVYAFSGLFEAIRKEEPLKVEVSAAVLALIASWHFRITRQEWLAVLTSIALVFITELINTAIEKLCDLVKPERNDTIRYIKDISAAAVIVACLLALCVAGLIFLPRMTA
jgi:diacylglycerol kinase